MNINVEKIITKNKNETKTMVFIFYFLFLFYFILFFAFFLFFYILIIFLVFVSEDFFKFWTDIDSKFITNYNPISKFKKTQIFVWLALFIGPC